MNFCTVCGQRRHDSNPACDHCGSAATVAEEGAPSTVPAQAQKTPPEPAPAPERAIGGGDVSPELAVGSESPEPEPPSAATNPVATVYAPITMVARPPSVPASASEQSAAGQGGEPATRQHLAPASPDAAPAPPAAQHPPQFAPGVPPQFPPPAPVQFLPYSPSPSVPPTSFPAQRRSGALATFVTVVVVLALGAGVATWLLVNRPSSSGAPAAQADGSRSHSSRSLTTPLATSSSTTAPQTQYSQPPATSPPSSVPTSSPPTTGGSGAGLVTVGAGAAGDPRVAGVRSFLTAYFTAINEHSYQQYRQILSPSAAQDVTQELFNKGFGSTHDSGATIRSIWTVSSGVTGVDVSFTSHQRVSQSANGATCTYWSSVTLYLDDYSGQYMLGPSPNDAQYGSCG